MGSSTDRRRLILALWSAWALILLARYFALLGSLPSLGPRDWLHAQHSLDAAIPTVRALLEPPHFPHASDAATRAGRGLLGAAAVLLAGYAVGVALVARLGPRDATPGERLALRLALGLGGLAYLLYGLAALALYRPGPTRALVALLALAGLVMLVRQTRNRAPPTLRVDRWLLPIALAHLVAFIGALAPTHEYDALWYHLWLPELWLEAGRPVDVIEEYISLYPLTWELLNGAALVGGGEIAATLLHFATLPLGALVVAAMARRWLPDVPPLLPAALYVTMPTVTWEATTAYVDLAAALYVALAVHALLVYRAGGDRGWLFAGSLALGFAIAIKWVALLVVAAIGTAGLLLGGARRRPLVIATATAVLVALPWAVRAWLASGNPVFPSLYGIFGAFPETRWSPEVDRALARFFDRFGPPAGRAPLFLAWDLTVSPERFSGSLGPLIALFAPLAATRLREPALRWLGLIALLFFLLWASPVSSLQLRFLILIAPLLALLAAAGVGSLFRLGGRPASLVSLGLFLLLVLNLWPFTSLHEPNRRGWEGWLTHVIHELPLAVVLGDESREEFLARRVPSFRAWRWIGENLPEESLVLTFSGGDHLLSDRPRLWSDSTMAWPATWGAPPGEETRAVAALRELGVTHILYDRAQLGALHPEELAIGQPAWIATHTDPLYEDESFLLVRLREPQTARDRRLGYESPSRTSIM